MEKEKIIEPGHPIIVNIYPGFKETVYYTGMTSKNFFSLSYQTHHVENEKMIMEDYLQISFSTKIKEVEFPSRTSLKFKIKNVTPTSLTAIVNEKH